MKMIRSLLPAIVILLFFSAEGFSASRDDMVRSYPDGAFGLDLGGGYEVAPIGRGGRQELLLPEAYRQDYRNTRYGPMTEQGFTLFPDFRFSDVQEREETEKEEEKKLRKDLMFETTGDATTQPERSTPLWGVYIPSEDK